MSIRKPTNLRLAVLWHDAIVLEKVLPPGQAATVGEALDNTLVLPDVVGIGARHTLFSPSGQGYTLHLTPGMKGRIRHDQAEESALEPRSGADVPVDGRDWGILDLGPIQIFFQFVGDTEKLPRRPLWVSLDSGALGALGAALALHFGAVLASFLLWDEQPQLETLQARDRLVGYVFDRPPEVAPREDAQERQEDVGKRAGGEEGQLGREDRKEPSRVPRREGQMVDKVAAQPLSELLRSNLVGRGPLQNVFSDKTRFASKLDAAMSGQAEGDLHVGHGTGGIGIRGLGDGGGGDGLGRIHGMGNLDTGGGRGVRASLGPRAPRPPRPPTGTSRKPEVEGFCKEADIQRVVAARRNGITYCYEKELARDPELQGRVQMNWRIGLDGKVMKVIVENSTLRNPAAEGCMARAIERWVFPKPDGGLCSIRYPFVFNAGL